HQKGLELIITIDPEVDCAIWVDEIRLKQIIQNLLSNAIKFTKKGEIEIAVKGFGKVRDISKMKFSVRDTGIGIKAENKNKILEAFTQEDGSTTRNFGGTGLGLTITNNLLQMMNSQLEIESKPGKGSTFSFDLLLKTEVCNNHKQLINNSLKNILTIEDNLLVNESIRQLFEQFDMKCQFSNTIENNNFQDFDLVLLDYEFLGAKKIEKLVKTFPKTNFFVMLNSTSSFIELEKFNNVQIIVKPIKIDVLQNFLNKINNKGKSSSLTLKKELSNNKNLTVLLAEDNKINLLLTKTLVLK